MKAFKVTGTGNVACMSGCLHCSRKIKVGQVVLVIERPDAPYGARIRHAHKSCVVALLERAGPEESEAQFDALRRDMVTSGMAFPTKV